MVEKVTGGTHTLPVFRLKGGFAVRFICFVVGVVLLVYSEVPAQKKRLSDVEMMLMILNNGHTRAILRDSTLFVYVIKGKSAIENYRECADIACANRLVVVTQKGVQEEKIKRAQ